MRLGTKGCQILSFEVLQVVGLEGLDIGGLAHHLLLGHAHKDVGTLLEQLRRTRRVVEDEQGSDDVGSHVVETTAQEVVLVLVGARLDLVEASLVGSHEFGHTLLQRLEALGDLTCSISFMMLR